MYIGNFAKIHVRVYTRLLDTQEYVFLLFHLVLGYSIILEVNYKEAALRLGFGRYGAY